MRIHYPLLIGTRGWAHPAWRGTYYPEDLPQDWELSFYGNEFPVVLIPSEAWQEEADASQWLEDSGEALFFICELELNAVSVDQIQEWIKKIAPLGKQCLGVVCRVAAEIAPQWATLEAALLACSKHYPTCVDFVSFAPDERTLHHLEHLYIGVCWHGEGAAQAMAYGPLVMARVDGANIAPKPLRQIIETCLEQAGEDGQAVLLLEGEPPDIETLRAAGTILDLL